MMDRTVMLVRCLTIGVTFVLLAVGVVTRDVRWTYAGLAYGACAGVVLLAAAWWIGRRR